jgi:hypothetical protein
MRTWLLGKGIDTDHYIRRLFRERPHLVPLLRNPFTAELIAEYAISGTSDRLPDSLYAVFHHYLSKRLNDDQAELARLNLSATEVRESAGIIAWKMYESSNFGLEADIDEIIRLLDSTSANQAEAVVEALRYTRLARVGGHDRRRFSFVHRRFAEFFVVDAMRRSGEALDLQAIPTDSRRRDCLVMYCGIVDLTTRQQIAAHCWSGIAGASDQIANGQMLEAREAIHYSRFLAEAFKSDREALANFRQPLGEVVTHLLRSKDLLAAKIGAELIPVIDERSQQEAITQAFETHSPWICDTTLNSCRHLGTLDQGTSLTIRVYLRSLPMEELFSRFTDISFSLNLSEAFKRQRLYLFFDLLQDISILCFILSLFIIVIFISPRHMVLGMVLETFLLLTASWWYPSIKIFQISMPFLQFRGAYDCSLRVLVVFLLEIIQNTYYSSSYSVSEIFWENFKFANFFTSLYLFVPEMFILIIVQAFIVVLAFITWDGPIQFFHSRWWLSHRRQLKIRKIISFISKILFFTFFLYTLGIIAPYVTQFKYAILDLRPFWLVYASDIIYAVLWYVLMVGMPGVFCWTFFPILLR